jgi:hypothetical protein
MLSSRVWRLALLTFFLIGPPLRAQDAREPVKKESEAEKAKKAQGKSTQNSLKAVEAKAVQEKKEQAKELAKAKGLSPNPSIRANGQVHLHDKRAEKKVEGDKEEFGEPHEHGCELAKTGNDKDKVRARGENSPKARPSPIIHWLISALSNRKFGDEVSCPPRWSLHWRNGVPISSTIEMNCSIRSLCQS